MDYDSFAHCYAANRKSDSPQTSERTEECNQLALVVHCHASKHFRCIHLFPPLHRSLGWWVTIDRSAHCIEAALIHFDGLKSPQDAKCSFVPPSVAYDTAGWST